MPRISVIMSVYNTKEKWLRKSIESILNQTYSDFEFIIINDGSTNNAQDVILSYTDKRIKYIKQPNQGLAKALNNGFKIATGEYIARMDSDDISLPNRFEKQVEFLDNNPDISLLGTWFEFFPKKQIIKHPQNVKYLDLMIGNIIGHPTVMLRRLDFEKFNLKYNESFEVAQDYELWSRAVRYLKCANLQEVLLNYRWCNENISNKKAELQQENTRLVQKSMINFLTDDITRRENLLEYIYKSKTNESKKYSFLKQIFSIKRKDWRKILIILGIYIKFRSKITK